MHQHYAPDGTPTGYTVVTRESVWDDSARARALAAVEFERSIDDRTGLPFQQAYKDQRFVVTDLDNYAAVAIEQRRLQDEEDAKHHPENYPKGWQQGRKYAVRPATSDELAELQARGQEVPGGD